MTVAFVNFPAIIADNDIVYYTNLRAFIESIDHESTLRITKNLQGINVRISPSRPIFLSPLIEQMKAFHTMYGIRLEFSKSMKKTCNVSFDIMN